MKYYIFQLQKILEEKKVLRREKKYSSEGNNNNMDMNFPYYAIFNQISCYILMMLFYASRKKRTIPGFCVFGGRFFLAILIFYTIIKNLYHEIKDFHHQLLVHILYTITENKK